MITFELYRFVMGNQIWTLTSTDVDQLYNAGDGLEVYRAVSLGRGTMDLKNEISKANIEIKLDIHHQLSVSLLTSFSEQILTLTIFTDREGDVTTTWKGRLVAIKPDEAFLGLVLESVFTSMRQPGLRARFQKNCRHPLYGRGCNLDHNDFEQVGTLSAIAGRTLTVPLAAGFSNTFFNGGMIKDSSGVFGYITYHVGDQVLLQRVPYTLITSFAEFGAATPITLYGGCLHSRDVCNSKFNNLLNYGGFDWIPTKNPMGGSSIV